MMSPSTVLKQSRPTPGGVQMDELRPDEQCDEPGADPRNFVSLDPTVDLTDGSDGSDGTARRRASRRAGLAALPLAIWSH